ncbi:response regulator transcription factor [Paraclostridium bifermentans]|uniref:response regulator transcription factor n=1 Tax=Paraclostridium bifermentans TaxID=1490 RepID=UPI00290B7AE0|nr:response regulator transcription factor [Paraclostridium bifermentans]MDU3337238.1 response regulator transcription factor [Paraclostridium bifermentans]
MNILILSNSFIIRDSISNLITKVYENINIDVFEIEDYKYKLKNKRYDLVIGNTYNTKLDDLKVLLKLKDNNTQLIILDQLKNENILKVCVDYNVDAYVTDFEDKVEFDYIMNKVLKGNKFYDSKVVNKLIGRMRTRDLELILTDREKEVMLEVSKGLSNREISKKLNITEFTVKKHLSHVMSKLNYKSRKEIILNNDLY